MTSIIVAGCAGRMGRRIMSCAVQDKKITVKGAFEHPGNAAIGQDVGVLLGATQQGVTVSSALSACAHKGAVIIDFTSPASSMAILKTAVALHMRVVIGTTGLSAKDKTAIKRASQSIPIVCAPNMSVGVNLMFKLSSMVASVLGEDYDVEIVEAHHRHKKDAPSGTAKELVRAIAASRKRSCDNDVVYGRAGMSGDRPCGSIGVHAVRGGDVVGEHTVSFLTEGERVELTHRASSRDTFAKGALVAAHFISKKRTGLYTMQDVLGFK